MASETMTVQEAIELCEPNDARASAEQWLTAMAVLVAHARATTAGTGAKLSYGYDDGEDCSDAWYELTTMAASTRPDDAYITDEWKLTFGQVRRYVEELRNRKAQKGTGASGVTLSTDAWIAPKGYAAVAPNVYVSDTHVIVTGSPHPTEDENDPRYHNCDAMGCGREHVVYRAALAPQGVTAGTVTAAMVEAAARVLFRQLAEENYALIHPDDIKVTREALRAALQAAGVGA